MTVGVGRSVREEGLGGKAGVVVVVVVVRNVGFGWLRNLAKGGVIDLSADVHARLTLCSPPFPSGSLPTKGSNYLSQGKLIPLT
ncbi:hypothetical protein ACOMHN_015023 [Nucella lapillus]